MSENTEVQLGRLFEKVSAIHDTTQEIRKEVKQQNGRVYSCEGRLDSHDEKISDNKQEIESQDKSIKKNTWRIGLLVGAIVGLEKVATYLAG